MRKVPQHQYEIVLQNGEQEREKARGRLNDEIRWTDRLLEDLRGRTDQEREKAAAVEPRRLNILRSRQRLRRDRARWNVPAQSPPVTYSPGCNRKEKSSHTASQDPSDWPDSPNALDPGASAHDGAPDENRRAPSARQSPARSALLMMSTMVGRDVRPAGHRKTGHPIAGSQIEFRILGAPRERRKTEDHLLRCIDP